jgi:hypothetical protein
MAVVVVVLRLMLLALLAMVQMVVFNLFGQTQPQAQFTAHAAAVVELIPLVLTALVVERVVLLEHKTG